MNDRSINGSVAFGVLVVGALGVLLFCDDSGRLLSRCGVNLLLWLGSVLITGMIIVWRCKITIDSDGGFLAAPILFLAAAFVWRADSFLLFWNGALVVICSLLLMMGFRVRALADPPHR
jgi:hypothetical protein